MAQRPRRLFWFDQKISLDHDQFMARAWSGGNECLGWRYSLQKNIVLLRHNIQHVIDTKNIRSYHSGFFLRSYALVADYHDLSLLCPATIVLSSRNLAILWQLT